MPTLQRVYEGCVLGEAPHWDNTSQNLYFVDIYGKSILRYKPSTGQTTKASFAPKAPTFIIPVEEKKDEFIVGAENELIIISWDGESDKISVVEKLTSFERSAKVPKKAFNDGKCDPTGRLWAGSQNLAPEISKTKPLGTLYSYCYEKNQLESHVEGIRIANGLAFNNQTKNMFYIDSLDGTVDRFDIDTSNGTISNRQVWFTLKKFNILAGIPDGMTIDTDGHLWVAVFGGSRILKVDGYKPEVLLDTIAIPAEQTTAVAFGGENLDELYVTTGALEIEGKKLPPPENGALYKIVGTGSQGLAGVSFKY